MKGTIKIFLKISVFYTFRNVCVINSAWMTCTLVREVLSTTHMHCPLVSHVSHKLKVGTNKSNKHLLWMIKLIFTSNSSYNFFQINFINLLHCYIYNKIGL